MRGKGGGDEAGEEAEGGSDDGNGGGWDEDDVGENAARGDTAEDVCSDGCAREPGRDGDDKTLGAVKIEMCAEAKRKENAKHDGEGKFGADVEEHDGIKDVDDEEGEAPGEDGVGAAHEDVRGKIDGGHASGADGAGSHTDEVGVGPEERDEEEPREADRDGATGEDGEEKLGDDHDV